MKIERGTFLRVAAGASATALNFLYPGLAKASGLGTARPQMTTPAPPSLPAGTVRDMSGLDPTVALGAVMSQNANGVVLQAGNEVRAVRIPSDTMVWKEFDVTPDVIQLNDWLHVKGTPQPDGSLLAQSGWVFVNIGRRNGVVAQNASSSGLTAQTLDRKSGFAIELSPRLEVISVEDGSLLPGHIANLTPGTTFGAVGLRLPNGGFRATRIWL